MAENSNPNARPFVIGANHRTSGLSVRDRLFIEDADVPAFLEQLKDHGIIEALVLSTCDRIEVQGMHDDPSYVDQRVREALASHSAMTVAELDDQIYALTDDVAVRHVFSVAASLDSQVIGEPQVLGQIKAAHRLAREAEMVPGAFEGLLQAAYGAAKRVRTETAIGERPVSIAAAGTELARGLHGNLERVSVVLIGVGELGEMIARQFQNEGVKTLAVSHPITSRATPVARELGCHVAEHDQLSDALIEADVIICAMGRRRYVLSADMLRAALKKRRNKPQFIIDTGIPGDVEPAANRIDEAFVYETSDLERVALEGKANREFEADEAIQIVDAEVASYLRTRVERGAVSVLTALRDHFNNVRDQVLAEGEGNAARATELVINKLLDQPSRALRDAATGPQASETERVVNKLFGLSASQSGQRNDEES